MNLILLQDSGLDAGRASLLRFALTGEPLANVVLGAMSGGLNRSTKRGNNRRSSIVCAPSGTIYAVPESWEIKSRLDRQQKRDDFDVKREIVYYKEGLPLDSVFVSQAGAVQSAGSWYAISNGRQLLLYQCIFIYRMGDCFLHQSLYAAALRRR